MRRGLLGVAVAAALGAGVAPPGAAQDIEAVARMRGLTLPDAYYARVQSDPTAYRLPNGLFRTTETGERVASRSEGVARLAVVLALFADSPEPHITRDMVQASLFDGPAPHGTVTEAYLEMSRGALTVTGDVFDWVRTSKPMAEVVGTANGLGSDADLGSYFTEALALVDPEVDFGLYDSDGPDGIPNSGDDDGYVDALTFEYLEVAGSCGGPSIWPHRWSINGATGGDGPFVTDDPAAGGGTIKIDGYITQSVADCTGQNVQTANVIAHEFGHVLGLPDYYHPTDSGGALGRRWILGCWELMAAGSWGCGPVDDRTDPFGPTHMSARTKHVLGWIEYFDPGEVTFQEVFLDPVQSSGKAMRIQVDDQGREFFIAEYRTLEGFDAQLPAEGVLMYKQDLDAPLRPDPASNTPYFLTLLEQDGNRGLQRNWYEGGNRGEATDAWGNNLGNTRKLHATTQPALTLSDGRSTRVTVHDVSLVDGRARLLISTSPQPTILPPSEPLEVERVASFVRFVQVAGGYQPYTVLGDAPETMTLSANGDEVFVGGFLTDEGPYDVTFRVRDARGTESAPVTVQILTTPWEVTVDELLQPFLASDEALLTVGERTFLDMVGNENGRYDIGDVRRWIRTGGAAASAQTAPAAARAGGAG